MSTGSLIALGVIVLLMTGCPWAIWCFNRLERRLLVGLAIPLAIICGATWPVTLLASVLVAGTLKLFGKEQP